MQGAAQAASRKKGVPATGTPAGEQGIATLKEVIQGCFALE
jgi:hypothetical protein